MNLLSKQVMMGAPAFDVHRFASDPLLNYRLDGAFDEMFSAEARPRRHYRGLYELLLRLPAEEMRRKSISRIQPVYKPECMLLPYSPFNR
jgi:hypothetical protein